jgi:hypothetical protein
MTLMRYSELDMSHEDMVTWCAAYLTRTGWMVERTHGPRNRPQEKGVSDLQAHKPAPGGYSRWVCLEIKIGKDPVRDYQGAWLARAREHGAMILVIRSPGDLLKAGV